MKLKFNHDLELTPRRVQLEINNIIFTLKI